MRLTLAVILEIVGVLAAIPVLVLGKVVLVLGRARLRTSQWLQALDRRIDRLRGKI